MMTGCGWSRAAWTGGGRALAAAAIALAHIGVADLDVMAETAAPVTGQRTAHEIDEAVMSGMATIRSAVIDNHTLITHRRFPPPMAAGFKARIEHALGSIRAGTSLAGESRAALDLVLTDIEAGVALAGPGHPALTQIDGLFQITAALERYGREFAHPGWMPIEER